MRYLKIYLAIVLGIVAQATWADADSSTPLALSNSSSGKHKQIKPAPKRSDVRQMPVAASSEQSSKKTATNQKSIKKLPPVNLQQSERIRQCLQTSTQTTSCANIYQNFIKYEVAVEEAATNANISPALLKAIVGIESRYNEKAQSKMGAIGLMQLMPKTAIGLGLNKQSIRDPIANLNAGALHLRKLLDQFADLEMAIAAYLLGEYAFQNRMPPKAMGYVQNTLLLYRYFEDPIKPVSVQLREIQ